MTEDTDKKMARRPAPLLIDDVVAAPAGQPRLSSAVSARRSIGSTITRVPTLTRE
jgi:hypothetical protein